MKLDRKAPVYQLTEFEFCVSLGMCTQELKHLSDTAFCYVVLYIVSSREVCKLIQEKLRAEEI